MRLSKLEEIIEMFQSVDDEMRLELLLDYSRKLPPLPERFVEQRDAGLHRVPECMTPVFMWLETQAGNLRLYVDVAEESPTVRGVLALILKGIDGATPGEVAQDLPSELVNELGLGGAIRMQRAVGLSAIVARIKRSAAEADKAASRIN